MNVEKVGQKIFKYAKGAIPTRLVSERAQRVRELNKAMDGGWEGPGEAAPGRLRSSVCRVQPPGLSLLFIVGSENHYSPWQPCLLSTDCIHGPHREKKKGGG